VATERLDVRLDRDRRRKLRELAAEYEVPVSETVRRLIDQAYEESLATRRRRAARSLAALKLENVPDPGELTRQLEGTYDADVH